MSTSPLATFGTGTATGIGSLPYADPREASRIVFGEVPDLPFVPELPSRGPHGSTLGRGIGLLVDLGAELGTPGWRVAPPRGRDQRQAAAMLAEDLDALESVAAGSAGGAAGSVAGGAPSVLKTQVVGPLTLAAWLELPSGRAVVGDEGARRDLAQSLAEGVRGHLDDLGRRFPGTDLVLQIDEPSMPAVLSGGIPTPSGISRYREVATDEATSLLAEVLGVGARTVVHCCASSIPVPLFLDAGADAVSFDLSSISVSELDSYGAAVEAGAVLFVGAVPTARPAKAIDSASVARRVLEWWRGLGFDEELAAERVVVTPACGLAGAEPDWAREALTLVRESAAHLAS